MDTTLDVADPSDWLHTPVTQLGPVEAALRCQEIKLRPNPIVQELVDLFQAARPEILQLGEDVKVFTESSGEGKGRGKRKLENTEHEDEDVRGEASRKRTRSQFRNHSATSNLAIDPSTDVNSDNDFQPDDGLIACPICNARMKEEAVFSHLDIHNTPDSLSKSHVNPMRSQHFANIPLSSRPPHKTMERLPQLNYSLLKDNALRRKFSEIGIPSSGPRPLLIRRHTEWINLVNANCDSTKPRSKRELLHELDIWDRTQGRQMLSASNGGGSATTVMNKDFDGAAWAASHDQDFKSLIAKARRKAAPKSEQTRTVDGPGCNTPDRADSSLDTSTGMTLEHAESNEANDHTPWRENGRPSADTQISQTKVSLIEVESDG